MAENQLINKQLTGSDIFKADLLDPFLLEEPGYPLHNGSSYLKIDRQCGILVSHIDPRPDNEVDLITLHKKLYYLVGWSLAEPHTVIVSLQDLIYFLKGKDAFGNKVDTFYKAFGRQLRILKDKLVNNCLV